MTRLLIFLVLITCFSIATMWFIENDGSVVINWMGYRIQTSTAFVTLASVILLVFLSIIIQILLWIKNAPKRYRKARLEKKRSRGLTALTEGFAAVAAGDAKQAKKLTKKAANNLGSIPLTKLLSAQTAQLDGDRELAKAHYTAMLESKETEIIAIKGLLIEARQDGDLEKAIFLAEKAVRLRPDADWAVSILLDLYKRTRRYKEAEYILDFALKRKLVSKDEYNHVISVIYAAQSMEDYRHSNFAEALKLAEKAYKLQPNFNPIIINYTRILAEDNRKKAARIIEEAWKNNPCSTLSDIYTDLFMSEHIEKRIKRIEKLMTINPDHYESHLAMAKICLKSGSLSKARNHLKIALSAAETSAICKMMADLERQEGSDTDIISNWLKRAQHAPSDDIFFCNECGYKDHFWHANCPDCSAFDSMAIRNAVNKNNSKGRVHMALAEPLRNKNPYDPEKLEAQN